MGEPLAFDIKIRTGSTYLQSFIWEDQNGDPYNLVGFQAVLHVRQDSASSGTLLELYSSNGDIIIGGVGGNFEIQINQDITKDITWNNAVYDMQMISPSGIFETLIYGNVLITTGITRNWLVI